jgi:hypothetical protein
MGLVARQTWRAGDDPRKHVASPSAAWVLLALTHLILSRLLAGREIGAWWLGRAEGSVQRGCQARTSRPLWRAMRSGVPAGASGTRSCARSPSG